MDGRAAVMDADTEIVRTLIVDDDSMYVHLLKRYLSQAGLYSFKVDSVSTAMLAISRCISCKYDLLLVDHNLPDLNGPQFLLELRSRLEQTVPTAIVMTAEGGEAAAGQALRAEAGDFLPKSLVNVESLSRSINNALAKDRLRKSVEDRSLDLQTANSKLKSKNQEIRQFYQKVSHEVKTPLAAAREFVSIIRDELVGPVNEEQVKILNYAITSCDQIATHFNDLVEITRLDSGKVNLRKSECSIDSILARTVASCTSALNACNLKLIQNIDVSDKSVWVDDNRITQVLSNLLGNAIKYSPNGSAIEISVNESTNQDLIEFCVMDYGCGIAIEETEKIFERLYQTSEVNHEFMGAGLGLGLSIAKEIVALHEGRIWVESQLNKGSQFFFQIPSCRSEIVPKS